MFIIVKLIIFNCGFSIKVIVVFLLQCLNYLLLIRQNGFKVIVVNPSLHGGRGDSLEIALLVPLNTCNNRIDVESSYIP